MKPSRDIRRLRNFGFALISDYHEKFHWNDVDCRLEKGHAIRKKVSEKEEWMERNGQPGAIPGTTCGPHWTVSATSLAASNWLMQSLMKYIPKHQVSKSPLQTGKHEKKGKLCECSKSVQSDKNRLVWLKVNNWEVNYSKCKADFVAVIQ